MTSPILVTGGTGTLGRLVVSRLRDAGSDVRVLSRKSRPAENGIAYVTGDLAKDQGIGPAVDGVRALVHCASDKKGDADATRNLVRAAEKAGVAHLVYISIVGVEDVSFGYFKSKLESERVVTESGLPWTLLRVTQFYDFILNGAQKAKKLPLVPVPSGFRVQPIDPEEVAVRLAELALDKPAGRVPDLVGPQATDAVAMIRAYLKAVHKGAPVVPLWMPGIGKIRSGGLLPKGPKDGYDTARVTWEEFLATKLG
ncbi:MULTISPECIES: SDR family oxidoreductase [unclassified Streptomyces]|uniref:NAD(P)H-binding protein n=1 Tax=Streptomyces sp. NBC_00060 TaxID=2975636 RepID=A0AAU2GYV0_9ACTN